MDLYTGKIGDIDVEADFQDGKLVLKESYALLPAINMIIDKLEVMIPGDQKAWAEMLKKLIEEYSKT